MKIHRTVSTELAVIQNDREVILVPWGDLLALRDLVSRVPPEAAWDEDYPRVEASPWAASGSSFGIALMHSNAETLYLNAEEWEELAALLYVDDDLLLITEVAELAGCSRQNVAQAIDRGDLFAFKRADLERRQWRVPQSAAREFAA